MDMAEKFALLEPYQLDPFLFEEFTTPQHLGCFGVTYKEELTQRPPAGYELCDGGDQFTRVCETFRVIIEQSCPPMIRPSITICRIKQLNIPMLPLHRVQGSQ